MKTWLTLAVVLVACGDNKKPPAAKKDDAAIITRPADAAVDVAIDSPPLLTCTPVSGTTMSMRQLGQVSGSATLATSPPNDGRLFVLEQHGRIRIFENDQLRTAPFLDITSKVTFGGEQGLLGLAFDPHYAQNGFFYVWYTTGACTTASPCFDVLERYHVSATDYDAADATSGTLILSIPDFATNHNAGMIEFGSDGDLYISTGDGGGAGDPHKNAQSVDRTASTCIQTACEPLLGKILRIDVDHPSATRPYSIPPGNPFAHGGGEPEIYIIGLRNPWRWSFDRATGDMWIGDVGQNTDEEIDFLPAGQQAGKNLGWSIFEAFRWTFTYTNDPTGKTFPVIVKNHVTDGWAAIIGGQVYRGPCYPDLTGMYFYTDWTKHTLSRATISGTTVTTVDLPAPAAGWPQQPSSIHADARGELYETTVNGFVYHLEAGPP